MIYSVGEKHMKILENEVDCVGCSLCASVCPRKCISMRMREGGFRYPQIDDALCISCEKCRKVCPVLAPKEKITPLDCYALIDKRTESRIKSASGGASNLFAEQIIREGGAFCGVRLDDDLRAVHDIADTLDELDAYRDSKYVQSDMSQVWEKISDILGAGKRILVSGTPCQIAAVKSRFGNRENLITCDLICSGVPDPKVFELYLSDLSREQGARVTAFYFRDKTNGWRKSNIKAVFEDGSIRIIERKDSYYFSLFGNNIYFRQSCFRCRFKDFKTCADITIGDYWGIEKQNLRFDDNKGCSVVIVNTPKGRELLESVLQYCDCEETSLAFAIETHAKLKGSIPMGVYRSLFYKRFEGDLKTLHKAVKITTGRSIVDRMRRKAYAIMNKKEKHHD